MKPNPKVAIVCDWLTGTGGAERVVLELHKMFPDAPIYTSQYNKDPKIWYGDKWFSDADVRTLWLQRLPKAFKKFLPVLRARAFSHLDLSDYDLVISSSGAEAKAVKTGPKTKHVCYCHAPTHYYWNRYNEYLKNPGFGIFNFLARLGLRLLVDPMRRWDYKAAQKPDYFVANSSYTKKQIKKYYGRDAEVIHPPVDIERFKPKGKAIKNGFLIAGRQTPYKRFDLAVAACTQLNVPLTVIGNGPEHNKLVGMAGPRVTFLNKVADKDMPHYFQRASAFIFPGIDDFGIVAVEALAAGTPVIA
jgi:glycosyltransferase involved in cell wall biosynthesis